MDSASPCVARGVQHLRKHPLRLAWGLRKLFGALSRDSVGANVTHRTLVSHWGLTISGKQKTPMTLQEVMA